MKILWKGVNPEPIFVVNQISAGLQKHVFLALRNRKSWVIIWWRLKDSFFLETFQTLPDKIQCIFFCKGCRITSKIHIETLQITGQNGRFNHKLWNNPHKIL